jgi:hypothetical protein
MINNKAMTAVTDDMHRSIGSIGRASIIDTDKCVGKVSTNQGGGRAHHVKPAGQSGQPKASVKNTVEIQTGVTTEIGNLVVTIAFAVYKHIIAITTNNIIIAVATIDNGRGVAIVANLVTTTPTADVDWTGA